MSEVDLKDFKESLNELNIFENDEFENTKLSKFKDNINKLIKRISIEYNEINYNSSNESDEFEHSELEQDKHVIFKNVITELFSTFEIKQLYKDMKLYIKYFFTNFANLLLEHTINPQEFNEYTLFRRYIFIDNNQNFTKRQREDDKLYIINDKDIYKEYNNVVNVIFLNEKDYTKKQTYNILNNTLINKTTFLELIHSYKEILHNPNITSITYKLIELIESTHKNDETSNKLENLYIIIKNIKKLINEFNESIY